MFSKIAVVNMPIITEADLVICPNPVVNIMDVRLDPFLFHSPSIEIRDISGKLIQSYQVTQIDVQKPFRIDLNELPQGMYFLQVSEQGYSISKRLVKK